MLTLEQKEIRKTGLGATDCAAVMGLSPYRTPYELWMIKTGRMEESAILSDDRLRLRHAHEETVAREYAFQKNCKLKRVNQTLFHPKHPYMLCNLDRIIIGQRKIVECKTSTAFLKHIWGMNGSDEAPIHYMLQVQHQLAVSQYDDADLAALLDIDDYRIFPMPRNERVIAKIEEACEKFWNENVLADVAPAPSNRGDLKLMYPINNGTYLDVTTDIISYIEGLSKIKFSMKELDKEKEGIEKEIIQFIASADGIKDGDRIIATYQANKNGTRVLRIKGEK